MMKDIHSSQPSKPRVQSDLELRIAEHSHTKFALRNGSTLREPPALEGYLHRYRRGTHLRDATNVATHDGNPFFVPTVSSHPPTPPTLPISPTNPIPLHDPVNTQTSRLRLPQTSQALCQHRHSHTLAKSHVVQRRSLPRSPIRFGVGIRAGRSVRGKEVSEFPSRIYTDCAH